MCGGMCEVFVFLHEMTLCCSRSSPFIRTYLYKKGVGSDCILSYYQALAWPSGWIIAITTHTLLDIVIPVGIAYLTKWGVIAIAFIPLQICEIWMQKKYNNNTFRFWKWPSSSLVATRHLLESAAAKVAFPGIMTKQIGWRTLTKWGKTGENVTRWLKNIKTWKIYALKVCCIT